MKTTIEMAREAGFHVGDQFVAGASEAELERLVELARADERAKLAEQPAQQEPEIVQRVKRFAGKTLRTARNPNITARECIELANWLAANTSPPQRKPLTDDQIRGLTPKPDGIAESNAMRVEVLPGVMGTEYDEVDAWSMPLVMQIARAIEAAHNIKENT